ncbi:MAG: hypothetical protein IT289_07130 [Oligoflexia bacterium]|nr:hypothetical protein [Oligoflexia bacterium]
MFKFLFVAALLASSNAFGGVKHCNCVELERRVGGLESVLRRANIGSYEREVVRKDIASAVSFLRQVDPYYTSDNEQARLCSLGAQACDSSWRRWQPWLAQNGMDKETYCDDYGPGDGGGYQVPNEGDRGCPRVQWKTEERARKGLRQREGHQGRRYEVFYDRYSSCYGYRRISNY